MPSMQSLVSTPRKGHKRRLEDAFGQVQDNTLCWSVEKRSRPLPPSPPVADGLVGGSPCHRTRMSSKQPAAAATANPAWLPLALAVPVPQAGEQASYGQRAPSRDDLIKVARPRLPHLPPPASPADEADEEEFLRLTDEAVRIHADVLGCYESSLEFFGKAEKGEDVEEGPARELAEEQVASVYERLCELVMRLTRWTEHEQSEGKASDGEVYDVAQFQGISPEKRRNCKAASLSAKMQLARDTPGRRGRARDALCAVLATLASRREMVWLQAYDVEEPVRGYFAPALVSPTSVFRWSLRRSPSSPGAPPRPASLLVTHHLPLMKALWKMDQCGPLPFEPRTWCKENRGSQFALQELASAEDGDRQHVDDIRSDPRLHRLLRTKTPVVLLDAYVALAPRELSRQHGLGEIAREELRAVLRESKERGQAVVFQLGGEDPHLLAYKVYLKPFFMEWGLRCGYLRWRSSSKESWAKEKPYQGRAVLGLQLP